MNKIIKITDEKILVGTTEGGIIEVKREELDFEPTIGEEVDIYKSEKEVIVSKKNNNQNKQKTNHNVANNGSNKREASAVSGKSVNKVAYILLAIFLGGLGIHKFYAGKTVAGVFYILFCWTFIPSLVAFIEAIIALFKESDANGNIVFD